MTLLRANRSDMAEIGERAREVCVAIAAEELPPGCEPPYARVGVETDPATGDALLHIEHGVVYDGPSRELDEWITSGTLRFSDFAALERWLRGPLADAFGGKSTVPGLRTIEPLIIDSSVLEDRINAEVVGQESATRELAEAITTHLARTRPRRPLTVLALGPTGVGKTLTAEQAAAAIAEHSGIACPFLRLDMSEFQEPHTISRLVGAPPGYIGHGEPPALARHLENATRAVVLFDEIEKAHEAVLTSIMNLMDAGRLTTGAGQTLDARGAILFFTTNLGTTANADETGDASLPGTAIRNYLRSHGMRPELVSRFHTTLRFSELDRSRRRQLMMLAVRRAADSFGLDLTAIDDEALQALDDLQVDPTLGARGVEYAIDKALGLHFANAVAKGLPGVTITGNPIQVLEIAPASRNEAA